MNAYFPNRTGDPGGRLVGRKSGNKLGTISVKPPIDLGHTFAQICLQRLHDIASDIDQAKCRSLPAHKRTTHIQISKYVDVFVSKDNVKLKIQSGAY